MRRVYIGALLWSSLLSFVSAAAAQEVQIDFSRFPDGTTVPTNQVISTQWQSQGILFNARASSEAIGMQGSVAPIVPGSGAGCGRYYFFTPDVFGAVGIFRFVEPGTGTPIDATHFEMVAGWEFGETVILVGFDQAGVQTASQTYNAPCGGFCSRVISLSGQFRTVELRTFGNPGIGFPNCRADGSYGLRFTPVPTDSDHDGVPDTTDTCPGHDDHQDADGDGTADGCDPCPQDPNNDADGDGVCGDVDSCAEGDDNLDSDNDGTPNACDVCPLEPTNDGDGDGFCESSDNCPTVSNPNQADVDGDGIGDACEADNDSDGIDDDRDNCPFNANADQVDTDGDGIGDVCDADVDGDGVVDVGDSCLATPAGEVVLPNGCSVAQECQCSAPWKNHGSYVSCVSQATTTLLAAGAITQAQKDAIQSAAAQSSCGAKK